jgi:hypothetical protein
MRLRSVAIWPVAAIMFLRLGGVTAHASNTPKPDGVPTSEVGSLVTNRYVGGGLMAWASHTLITWNCDGGSVTRSGGLADLDTNGTQWNCAGLQSLGSYNQGIFESRIYFPAAPNGEVANWPAFWLSGNPWPYRGEIDAAEGLAGCLKITYHYNADGPALTAPYTPAATVSHCVTTQPGWHTVTFVWRGQTISFYYDGKLVYTISGTFVVDAPEQIIIENTEGQYGNQPGTPAHLYVQYVRVWHVK